MIRVSKWEREVNVARQVMGAAAATNHRYHVNRTWSGKIPNSILFKSLL